MSKSNYIVLGVIGGIGSQPYRQLRAAGSNVLLGEQNEARLANLGWEAEGGEQSYS